MIDLRSLARLGGARSRSISPENFDGAKGGGARATEGTGAACAADLGPGWKISPSVDIAGCTTHELAEIDGPALITHIWLTTHNTNWRSLILRAYWDGADEPAIEVPLGDFFGQGWGEFAQLSSVPVAANPHGGFNSYWPMPVPRRARLTCENRGSSAATVYYQISYETYQTCEAGADMTGTGYLHCQFHRSNPLATGAVHPILDPVSGAGKYVGTYLAWGVNSPGWWGEGEVKFYLDGDEEFPTICGTGTEDYFGGAWNFDVPGRGYTAYSTPFLGLHQILRPDGLYRSQQRFGMYRWHLLDPIHFHTDLRADIQALGWRSGHRYRPLHDDIASTAFFYLDRPSAPRPPLPSADELEVGSESD
ncbi:MAG TPA: glycoside hydrolase family 172 protein [Mycobacterium sp.]